MANNNFIQLSALAHAVEAVVRNAFGTATYWVIADVTSHTFKAATNYHYFELVEKEEGGQHVVTKFAARAWGAGSRAIESFEQATGQRFTNNIHVLVQVSVAYHPQFGLQLQLHAIEASYTLGRIAQQRQQTLARLVAENTDIHLLGDAYRTPNKSRPLPPVLQRLAVISSKASAGLNDFKHTLDGNAWGYRFSCQEYFTEVQGEANAMSLRQLLIDIYQSGKAYDAVVMIRGGGAQTDFLLFDNYLVAQAIARFPIPIITGIGHQHNTSIADMMAHTQTKTPTEAAAFIIAHNRAFEEQLLHFQQSILVRSQQLFVSQQQSLSALRHKIVQDSRALLHEQGAALQQHRELTVTYVRELLFGYRATLLSMAGRVSTRPALILQHRASALKNTCTQVRAYQAAYLKNRQGELAHYKAVIHLLSPAATLRRGFALVKKDAQVLSNAGSLQAGDHISIILADAALQATITQKDYYDGTTFKL
ncbi:Exodeoxyribonuclease VII large subunit [Chitinophaga costaii]|uniref:Exodeoxyribonuclease 7 large subunit n=1 Tax=Chitinophaga costaii TaxID=1335309 RepID=A0A1C3YZM5_9BACT|nr:exodeoxyribonuclease VII large subunit [Chitinophaga costaii]PUZ30171.1 exodeoxyribonuclease VII large subunit [Chitinophaga costaii]SCB75529.1 Exodeoxyribonuclease VII large subunit [Chitinophaga costaii]